MAACAFSRNGFTSLGRSIRFIIEIRFGVAVVMAATANYLIEMAEKLLESTIRRSHNTILHKFNNNRKKIQCWHVWSVLLTNIMCFIAMLSFKKNSSGLVIISRYGVLKTVRTRGPYMHMCICACAHCFHATATNPP